MAKAGKTQTSSTTEVQKLSPEQQQILNAAMPTFMQYLQPDSVQVYQGSTVAPTSPYTTLGQAATAGAVPTAQQVAGNAAQGNSFLTSGAVLDPNTNPGLAGTIDAALRPVTENYNNILGGIRDNAVMTGGYGGSRQGIVEGMANRDYLRQVGDTTSQILNQNYQTGLNAMTTAQQAAPGVTFAQSLPGQFLSAIGSEDQAQSQAELSDVVNKYYTEQLLPLMLAEDITGLSFGIPAGSATGTSSSSQPKVSTAEQVMGYLSTALSLAGVVAAI